MKRKIAILLSIFLTLQLCSCASGASQPAAEPETSLEISRGETGEEVNKLAASAVAYTDSFQSADGTVNVEINLEDSSLYEGSFQTLQITPRPFAEEEVRHIAGVLFGDAVLYNTNDLMDREATKAERQEQHEMLQSFLESDGLAEVFGEENLKSESFDPAADIREYMEKNRVEDAPESIEQTVCDFVFKPWDPLSRGGIKDDLEIMAQTDVDGIPYRFNAVNNTNGGIRVYRISAFIADDIGWPHSLDEVLYRDKLLSREEPTQEQSEAVREKAEKLIAELDMGQWQIDSCKTVEYRYFKAIRVTAVPVYNGIVMLRQPQPSSLRGTEEGIQNCYYPDLYITFSADGKLIDFAMTTPVDIISGKGEENRMMSFAELMGSIKAQFSQYPASHYTDLFCYDKNQTVEVVIDRIELGYDMVQVSECPSEVLEYCGVEIMVNNSDFLLLPSVYVYGNFRTVPASPDEESTFDYRRDMGNDALFAVLDAANGGLIAPVNSGLILAMGG